MQHILCMAQTGKSGVRGRESFISRTMASFFLERIRVTQFRVTRDKRGYDECFLIFSLSHICPAEAGRQCGGSWQRQSGRTQRPTPSGKSGSNSDCLDAVDEKFGGDDHWGEEAGGSVEEAESRLLADVGDMAEVPGYEVVDLVERGEGDV